MWDVKLESFIEPLDLNLDWCLAIDYYIRGKEMCNIQCIGHAVSM